VAGRIENLKPFKKGDDSRRNRNGRPKSFDALRKLAQQIATEDVKQGGQPLIIDGHKVTVIEAVMRALASSCLLSPFDTAGGRRCVPYSCRAIPNKTKKLHNSSTPTQHSNINSQHTVEQ